MQPKKDQLPVQYEFTEQDIQNLPLTPTQRAYVETRLADVIMQLGSLKVDTQDVSKFIQRQAYLSGIRDFAQDLLSITGE